MQVRGSVCLTGTAVVLKTLCLSVLGVLELFVKANSFFVSVIWKAGTDKEVSAFCVTFP